MSDERSWAGSSQRSTMRDVAALAGVSTKTVSRVINGERYVSVEIGQQVRAAMTSLNYRHNLAASQLRARTNSAAIGLILVDISNPFSSAVHRAVEDVFRGSGVVVLSASTDEDPSRARDAVAAFAVRRVDGLIVMPPSHDHRYLALEVEAGTHVVLVDRPPSLLKADWVVSGNHEGARAGMAHLIEHGHRRIAFVGDWPDVISSQQRYDGYVVALSQAGIDVDVSLDLRGFADHDQVERRVHDMLIRTDAPTAVFVAQNALCAPVVRALRRLGLHNATAVVGFDGFEGADLIEPGLTVVAQDPVLMGTLAAEILMKRLAGDTSVEREVVLPTRLVVRGSGEIEGPTPIRESLSAT